jgi:hypothetical protein
MSLGMLIQPPIEQTPKLLRDVGLAVFNIADGIRLLLCRVYNVCLEPEPCCMHNHLLGHDNWKTPKRHRNGGPRRMTGIPLVTNFASSLEEIEFTQLQDPRLERYTNALLTIQRTQMWAQIRNSERRRSWGTLPSSQHFEGYRGVLELRDGTRKN